MWLRRSTRSLTTTVVTCLATVVATGCDDGAAPQISLADAVAQVGVELKLDLNGTDPDGDRLAYSFRAASLPDIGSAAMVTVSPSGAGVFRWTPLGQDVGEHLFDFTVSDPNDNATTVTIAIDVKSAVGSATAPIFRQPLGTGTTVDMAATECVDVDIVIEDQDSPGVTITQEEPLIEGAELQDSGDGLTATWHWCPTRDQATQSRYTVVLSADDGDNPKTIKNFLVVLRGEGGGTNCPGAAPVIAHTAGDQTTRLDLNIAASITDDKGLKDLPLLYYSTTQPANPPNLATMTQVSMALGTGTNYTGRIPNPVAMATMGTSETVYYVIVADDDDDETGNCDHSTRSTTYQMKVTAGGGATAGVCEPCTADTQCGTGNLCVYVGNMGDSYCLESCTGGCDAGYGCSTGLVYSVDGAQERQCVPQSGSCTAPTGVCMDDTYEENDTRTVAGTNPALTSNALISAVSCPSTTSSFASDDDFYKIVLAEPTRIKLELAGDGFSDLDVHLQKSDGTLVTASTSLDYNEEINTCVAAGTYYARINAYGHKRSEYLFATTETPEACSNCVDDAREMDDTFSQAKVGTYPTTTVTGSKICPNDDDWVKIPVLEGDQVTIDLTFNQTSFTEDLDLHMYRNTPQALTDLWPCSFEDPTGCTAAHGQGYVSNEHATFTVPACPSTSCDYFVVVRGWNGASNTYGLTINIQ